MRDYPTITLGEVVDLLTGNPFRSGAYVDDNSNPKLLRGDNIAQGYLRWENVKRWPRTKLDDLGRYALEIDDVVLAMDRPWIDAGLKYARVACEDLPAYLVQRVARLRGTARLRTGFLRYLIGSPAFTNHVLGVQTGTAVPHISAGQIKAFEFFLPPLEIQDEIAAVLSALDDKIELNRRMNETLEGMAQAIFKDWFVDFGPVRRKLAGVTDPAAIMGGLTPTRAAELATLFPDGFGADGLPKGWAQESLLDVAHWINGAAYKNMHFVPKEAGLPVIKIAELKSGVTEQTKFTNTDLGNKYRIVDGELLFSWSGNPDTSIDAFIWTGGEAWLNQHIFAVRENGSRTKPCLFVLLKYLMPEFAELARNKQTTGLGHVTKDDMKRLMVAKPPLAIVNSFSAIVAPIYEKIVLTLHEDRTLAETRDYLLPKLMSGEVRVRDVEKMVEDGVAVQESAAVVSNVIAFPTDLLGQPYLSDDQETERDAVMVSAVVRAFHRHGTVVGNVKVQKGCYFIRRFKKLSVGTFDKKAAGPYDRHLNHEGGKGEALGKGWIIESNSAGAGGKLFEGNAPGSRFGEIAALVERYGLKEAVEWVSRNLASKSRDELECLATVDFAMETLAAKGVAASLQTVKADIASDPEWKPKLRKTHFSDDAIRKAIAELTKLFASRGSA
jgi:type I restriction enzyme, S subunit